MKKKIIFIAPGLLAVPNRRGGGIENFIYNLAFHSKTPCTIFSPKSKTRQKKKARNI